MNNIGDLKLHNETRLPILVLSQKSIALWTEKLIKTLKGAGKYHFIFKWLDDYQILECKRCCICVQKGIAHCPIDDDRIKLEQELLQYSILIFIFPHSSFSRAGQLSRLEQRFKNVYHRPRFMKKKIMFLVMGRGRLNIRNQFKKKIQHWGFSHYCCLRLPEWQKTKARQKIKLIHNMKEKFLLLIEQDFNQVPFQAILLFHLKKAFVRFHQKQSKADFTYWENQEWLDQAYYYPIQLNRLKCGSIKAIVFVYRLWLHFGRKK